LTYDERQLLFKRCRSYLNVGEYPIGWFRPSVDVKRENVILWILWALFSTESYQPEWEEEINEYLSQVESILGRKLDGGFSEKAKSMRLTFDPVVMLHRPLVWYFVSFSPYATHIISCIVHVPDCREFGYLLIAIDPQSWISSLCHSSVVPVLSTSPSNYSIPKISRP
jgi:hypothetical protein